MRRRVIKRREFRSAGSGLNDSLIPNSHNDSDQNRCHNPILQFSDSIQDQPHYVDRPWDTSLASRVFIVQAQDTGY